MKLPRFLHRLYAALRGYYWLPCPLCGNYRGGHEESGGTLYDPGTFAGRGRSVCADPMCKAEADRRNKALGQKEGWWFEDEWGPAPRGQGIWIEIPRGDKRGGVPG